MEEREYNKNPREGANLCSIMFMIYTFPTYAIGRKRDFKDSDIYRVLEQDRSHHLGNVLERAWKKQLNESKPSLLKALYIAFRRTYFKQCCCLMLLELFQITQPIALYYLIMCYAPERANKSKAYAYIAAVYLGVNTLTYSCFAHLYYLWAQELGMRMRVATSALIYRKCLRLDKNAEYGTIGRIINLLSNDTNRFDFISVHLPYIPVIPIETISMIVVAYLYTGYTSMVCLGIMFLSFPIQVWLASAFSKLRKRTAEKTDERVRLMNEIICGVQIIKMYAWEQPFEELIAEVRKLEIKQIHAACNIKAFLYSLSMFLPRFAVFCSVLLWFSSNDKLVPEYVFTLIAIVNFVRRSVTIILPAMIPNMAELLVAIGRIEEYLLSEEFIKRTSHAHRVADFGSKGPKGVWIDNGTARWSKVPDNSYTLQNLNIILNKTDLVCLIGSVGCGKSSLFQVILQELPLTQGTISIKGSVSYAPQDPWLFSGTIRQNILFGSRFNYNRYHQVIYVCCLRRDFVLMPFGDSTIVGDRGIALSGGQRARVNLARAVYRDSDIYLLDDPLSALDAQVGSHIFTHCILDYLKNKCVLLATHQLQYLKMMDRVMLMQHGEIVFEGPFDEVLKVYLPHYEVEDLIYPEITIPIANIASSTAFTVTSVREQNGEITAEGKVITDVYLTYINAGGNIFSFSFLILIFLLTQALISVSDYYYSFWINHGGKMDMLYIYSGMIIFLIAITIIRSILFFIFCMRASINLHNDMFNSILHAPMKFFNKNPSGRILNRFSKDIGVIDDILPLVFCDSTQILMQMMGILILTAIICPILIAPLILLVGVSWYLQNLFTKTSRGIKRLEGTTKSPIFTHTNASLQGLSMIRAFDAEKLSINLFDKFQDVNTSIFFLYLCISRAFGFYLDLLCSIYVCFTCILFVVFNYGNDGTTIGLAITQSLGLTMLFQWGLRQFTEVQNYLTSVERIYEYTQIQSERTALIIQQPRPTWPEQGEIEFKSVYFRYTKWEECVLRDLNFRVLPKEKIGIVGRTGAGKSSLIKALFQLGETLGEIFIDGIDIRTIPLWKLRSTISIIPQEPVLFAGTLRKNLDPFDNYEDTVLWQALDQVELKTIFTEQPLGLSSIVEEGGENFSVGERQLICLARATVKHNKILVLDEATANVDQKTDAIIQHSIRTYFEDCTVLTVAHRLNTVMDSDKILVLDDGQLQEFDTPSVLMKNKNSAFYNLMKASGMKFVNNELVPDSDEDN